MTAICIVDPTWCGESSLPPTCKNVSFRNNFLEENAVGTPVKLEPCLRVRFSFISHNFDFDTRPLKSELRTPLAAAA